MTRPTPTESTGSNTTPTGSTKPTRQGLTDRQPSSARHRPEPMAPPAEHEPEPEAGPDPERESDIEPDFGPGPDRPAPASRPPRPRPPPGRVSPQALADARGGAGGGPPPLRRAPASPGSIP